MPTRQEFLSYAQSLVNQRVTVPTNPYGGQCAAFSDHLVQWVTNGRKNLAYTNAIDLLSTAQAQGLSVQYWPNANIEPGDIWVCRTYSHPYGHTGMFLTGGGQPITLEQNVDGNWDALENGGWVREKQRLLYADGTMNYNPQLETQTLVGVIKLPFSDRATASAVVTKPKESETDIRRKKTNMFGSFLFSVKEGDGEFGKGVVYFYNSNTNEITGMHNQEELRYIQEWYKDATKEDIPCKSYSIKAPVYRRLFPGLGTDTSKTTAGKLSAVTKKLDDILKNVANLDKETVVKEIQNAQKAATEAPKSDGTVSEKDVKGSDILNKQFFKATVNLNIRDTASLKGNKVGLLKKGETVEIIQSAHAEGYYWVGFKKDDKVVFVASKEEHGDTYGDLTDSFK